MKFDGSLRTTEIYEKGILKYDDVPSKSLGNMDMLDRSVE